MISSVAQLFGGPKFGRYTPVPPVPCGSSKDRFTPTLSFIRRRLVKEM